MKQNHEIKLIALDMDGTLLNDSHEISAYTKSVISEVTAKGVHIVLSTGRWFDTCYPYAKSLNLNTYIITVNGGEIWTPSKRLLKNNLLSTKLIEEMYDFGEEIGINMWMVSTTDVFYAARPDDLYDYEWLKFGCNSEDETKLEKMKKRLSTYKELAVTNSLPTNLEVNPFGVNKAVALKVVCQELNILMDEVLAIGDSLNDLEMIKQAGIGVAVGNAQSVVREIADYQTETNNNDGVAKAIERFVR